MNEQSLSVSRHVVKSTYNVAMVGPRGAGKTVFLAAMYKALRQFKKDRGFYLEAERPNAKALNQAFYRLNSQQWIDPTAYDELSEMLFTVRVRNSDGRVFSSCAFNYIDYAGGNLTTTKATMAADAVDRKLQDADCFLALLDGFKLQQLVTKPDGAFAAEFRESDLPAILDPIRSVPDGKTIRPIQFIISKWDHIQSEWDHIQSEDVTLGQIKQALFKIEEFADFVETISVPLRLIPISAVGFEFVDRWDVQEDSQQPVMVIREGAEAEPWNVEMPISCVLPDIIKGMQKKVIQEQEEAHRAKLLANISNEISVFELTLLCFSELQRNLDIEFPESELADMMINVFPFLVSATKKEGFRELVLPDFLGKDDRYVFPRITPGHGRMNDTIYSRRVKLQDGSDWRVFQNGFQTDSLDHVGRNIPRIEGFFVRESKADQVGISKETFAEIKRKLTPHFLAAQKWDRGHPTTVLSEPWQLKPGHQEVVEVLPALDIRQEVDAFHARPEAQEKKRASGGLQSRDRLQESGPGWGGGGAGSMGSANDPHGSQGLNPGESEKPMSEDSSAHAGDAPGAPQPLADRLRPTRLADVVGQDHLIGEDGTLTRMLRTGRIGPVVFWGPPGTGKTTLARLLSAEIDLAFDLTFDQVSAIYSGVADLKKVFQQARDCRGIRQGTLLFLDENYRFNKAQQDAFLPVLEDGTITLVGATTENPSFELNAARPSRAQVLVFRPLDAPALDALLARAEDVEGRDLPLNPEARQSLVRMADGDGRALLTLAGEVWQAVGDNETLDAAKLQSILQRRAPIHDKSTDGHYNLISALHKCVVRGSASGAPFTSDELVALAEIDEQVRSRRHALLALDPIRLWRSA